MKVMIAMRPISRAFDRGAMLHLQLYVCSRDDSARRRKLCWPDLHHHDN